MGNHRPDYSRGAQYMQHLLQRVARHAADFGIDLRRVRKSVTRIPGFIAEARAYQRANRSPAFALGMRQLRPALFDRDVAADAFDSHYFYQDLWAARKIFAVRPARHVDVGSRVDGFVAHLLTFMPVTILDVRPLSRRVTGLDFVLGDASHLSPFADQSLESLSCLHALEHFGLGRYGDPINPEAWSEALAAFVRVLRPGGRLYLSVPVGRQRLEFNAHRVFAPATILAALADLQLLSFAAVTDQGTFHENADPNDCSEAWYACGMFELMKPRC
jgi:SAM-dependent methyltransferase